MATTNAFKQYERGQRTQLSEAKFGMGMNYTNMPLQEGFSRLLVNVNISDDGMSLSPREGLQPYKTAALDASQSFEVRDPESLKIVDTKVVHKEGDITYHHLIVAEKVEEDYKLRHFLVDGATYKLSNRYSCAYSKEEIPSIHDVPVSDNALIAPTGTFAWNGDYYYFNNTGHLMHTVWDSEVGLKEPKEVDRPELTPADASLRGYNMLEANPYQFSDTEGTGDQDRIFLGLMCYTSDGGLELNPSRNTKYTYRCYYEGGRSGDKIKWEWREPGADSWQIIEEQTAEAGGPISVQFSSPVKDFMIQVTCTKTEPTESVTSRLLQAFVFEEDTDKQLELKKYDLSTTKNLVYWKNRLIVGGTEEDRTLLFMSLPDDPGYFPYPKWYDQFDEPIMNVVPFLDNLLVFTASQLYQITLDPAGTFIKICLQENLNINTWDRHLTQIVKNMLFFKSGNYYYMVVPKANSMTGELTIAPISRNMKEFFDSFEDNVAELMKDVYDYTGPMDLVHYYNFLDYESVYNVYMYKIKENLYINVCLLYNSVKRYWKINVYESSNQLLPIIQDATKSGTLIELGFNSRLLGWSEYPEDTQRVRYTPKIVYLQHDPVRLSENKALIKNTLYIDTGYREHNSDIKKRYRELQFVVDNPTCNNLKLYNSFYVDGDTRQIAYRYEPVFNTKDNTVVMQKVFLNALEVAGNTVLDLWELSFSEFPSTTIWKLRTPVSGKGYSPRIVLRSESSFPFKLLKACWVYRTMNSR